MMKSAAIFMSTLASLAHASTKITRTDNECFANEGGRFVENCDDVYFLTCDVYEVDGGESCNVFTYSDSRMTWLTKELQVFQQTFYLRQDLNSDQEYDSKDFGSVEDNSLCYPDEAGSGSYKNGQVMNHTGGMCGTKFLVTNLNGSFS